MTAVLGALLPNGVLTTSAMGDKWSLLGGITFSSTYKTGGDATVGTELEKYLLQLGRGTVDFVAVDAPVGYVLKYDYANNKLMLFRTGAAVKGVFEENPEEAYPAALTAVKSRFFAIGR